MKIVFTTIMFEEAIAYCDANSEKNYIIERTMYGQYNVLYAG